MEKQNHKDDITVKHIADARRKSEGEDSPDGIEYKKTNKSTANAEALLLLFEEAPGNFSFSLDNYSSFGNVDLSKASAMLEGLDYTIEDIEFICNMFHCYIVFMILLFHYLTCFSFLNIAPSYSAL